MQQLGETKEEPHGKERSRVFAVVEEDGRAWKKKTQRDVYMAVYCGHVHFQVSQCRTMTRPN